MFKFPAVSLRNSIFVRLVFTYLFVVIPIILLGLYLYQWSYKNASQDISRATAKQLNYYLGTLDREVEWIELQLFDMVEDSGLNTLSVTWDFIDNADKRSELSRLLQRMTSVQNSSPYIKDIYIHIRSINKTLSTAEAIQDFDLIQYYFFRSGAKESEHRLIKWNNSIYLNGSKESGRKGAEPLFTVQIELDVEKLQKSLEQVNLYPESGSLLLSESAGIVLSTDKDADLAIQDFIRNSPSNHDAVVMKLKSKTFQMNKVYSDATGLSVAMYLPEETVKRPLSTFPKWAWIFIITSFLAVVVFSYSSYRIIHQPLLKLIQGFKRMEGGSLDSHIEHERKDEFGYLYTRFNHMLSKLQTLIDQDFKQKMMMQKAELKQLQSQINPHFLYNSFFILNTLSRMGDADRIEKFTNMLGEYFRFITRNGEDYVALSEEIKHSRTYTEIQNLRFSRRITVFFDELPKEMECIRVPRLIVQPIIENAYEHSLEKMEEDGILHVAFEKNQNEILIRIEDNGNAITDSELESLREHLSHTADSYEITGMINIHRRLVLTFGEGSGLFLSKSKLNGLEVLIRIKTEEEIDCIGS